MQPFDILFAQEAGAGAGAGDTTIQIIVLIVELGLAVLTVAGIWKTFEKAGEPGWAAIVPIYNTIVMLKIADKPIWWIVLMFIPCVGIFVFIPVSISIAQRFGKGVGFGLGLFFLPFVFYPILGFSKS